MKNWLIAFAFLLFGLTACHIKKHADFIVVNAKVYTVDSAFSTVEAFAISNGKIIAVGTNEEMRDLFAANEEIDAEGKVIVPGFIDSHAHFSMYGEQLEELDLSATKSWEQIIEKAADYADTHPDGWVIGGGWDQNNWDLKAFPDKRLLDSIFPDRPVILTHLYGHAAIANQVALDKAKITAGQLVEDGQIIDENGVLTGLLIGSAIDLVKAQLPELTKKQRTQALLQAAKNAFAAGLTTVDDCGLNHTDVELISDLQKSRELKMRLYVMLNDKPENYDFLFKRGKIKTDYLNVSSFKVYADGYLGSREACLLQPYNDQRNSYGFMTSSEEHLRDIAKKIYNSDFQLCTHAVGDSANRTILKIYAEILKGKNDRRWRIEHAQVIHPSDLDLFGANSIVPSVQPEHATSDMYWAKNRLGRQRVKNAYAYQDLLKQNGWIALGTDFPREDISPLHTFYAAVVRKDFQNYPAKGFQIENALSREQALKGMTIWAAKANFEDHEKGSLEPGKFADFVILTQDIMTVEDNKIPQTRVLATYIAGEKVYQR